MEVPAALTNARLEIRDVQGRMVLQTPVRNGEVVNVRALARGLYLSRLAAGDVVGTSKFVKE